MDLMEIIKTRRPDRVKQGELKPMLKPSWIFFRGFILVFRQ